MSEPTSGQLRAIFSAESAAPPISFLRARLRNRKIIIMFVIVIVIDTVIIATMSSIKPARHDEEYDGCKEKDHSGKAADYHLSRTMMTTTMMKTHSGEKSNKCNQCDYASSQAGHLRRHLKRHIRGEKSNKCHQCDFASSQAGNLKRHLETHNEEKSHKCNLCDYASSQARNLRRHIKIHSGEKSNNKQ